MKEKINPKVDYWKVTAILPVNQGNLYRAAYSLQNTNILDVIQQQWTEAVWLTEYFKVHKRDLDAIAEPMNTTKARKKVMREATVLFKVLENSNNQDIINLFKPLDNRELNSSSYDFQKCKARVAEPSAWLRLYAIHFEGDYIITRGAIKLTDHMKRKHLKTELEKMEAIISYIKDNPGKRYAP
jgi:hypothetical protein